jgi:hypothetical protein
MDAKTKRINGTADERRYTQISIYRIAVMVSENLSAVHLRSSAVRLFFAFFFAFIRG